MFEKLKSRKLWATIASYLVIALNDVLEVGIEKETIFSLVALITGYNAAQGYVDAQKPKPPTQA